MIHINANLPIVIELNNSGSQIVNTNVNKSSNIYSVYIVLTTTITSLIMHLGYSLNLIYNSVGIKNNISNNVSSL